MLLVAGTLVLVLYVLPQRYVLSSGFREGSLLFPSPTTPFQPGSSIRVAALPSLRDDRVVQGPAEIFWDEVLPLLEAGQYDAAIPVFARYLGASAEDRDVRREYAITLTRAGYGDRAIPVLESLLASADEPDLRLLLARTLRDEGRVAAASTHYRLLLTTSPHDSALALEWARALAWIEDYEGAENVILAALRSADDPLLLRAELAAIYYYSNRLEEADAILSGMSGVELDLAGVRALRDDVTTALTPPPEPPSEPAPPLSLLAQAINAREAKDVTSASRLFTAAAAATPDDAAVWLAYADFLQYSLGDVPAALAALMEVERLGEGGDARLQYRMALLQIWIDQPERARARLESLLTTLDASRPDDEDDEPVSKADVQALLGDLLRWNGERLPAVRRYELALAEDSDHVRAIEGLSVLRADVDAQLLEAERPGAGGTTRSWADTDEFSQFEVAAFWDGVRDDWAWGVRGGNRWMDGIDLGGAAGTRQGLVAEFEGARWWRWGTVRTGAHLGVQSVRSNAVDVSAGISARFVGEAGRRTDLAFEHAPAYSLTNTLQASAANVQHDRISMAHAQPLNENWSVSATAEAVSFDHRGLVGTDRNTRLAGGVSLGRAVTRQLAVGIAARALTYENAAPEDSGLSIYWDPRSSLSLGPYAQVSRQLGALWELNARVNPGISWIRERRDVGSQSVPDLGGRLGLEREGPRFRTSVEFSYGQGRFDGYRSYGVDFSLSARGWPGGAGGDP